MNLTAMQALAEQLLKRRKAHIDREKGGIYYHGQRVANTARLLRHAILPDDASHDDILTIASWFHDIGKDIEPHGHYGALLARDALRPHCAPEELDEICEIIALHCERKPGENDYSPWTKLLQDADMLDHYGSYTLWMDIWGSVCQDGSWEALAFYDEANWAKHCAKNRALLNYELSRRIFDEKIAFVNALYARMRIECGGEIVGLEEMLSC